MEERAGPLRVTVALSDPEQERALLPGLGADDDIAVVARCFGADELLARAAHADIHGVLVSYDLHGLNDDRLRALTRIGVPVVALAPRSGGGPPAGTTASVAAVVPADASAEAVCQALRAAAGMRAGLPATQVPEGLRAAAAPPVPGEDAATPATPGTSGLADTGDPLPATDRWRQTRYAPFQAAVTAAGFGVTAPPPEPPATLEPSPAGAREGHLAAALAVDAGPADAESAAAGLSVIALASGYGSPGRTTLALNLAVALGAVAPTVLVDLDMAGPAVAAHIDADPTRNVYMVAHADPQTPGEWDRAIRQELRPLAARSPHAMVLCGVPKPEMRSGVSPRFVERLLAELRQRFRYVVVDTGAELLGTEMQVHRAALAQADQVLLVAAGDLVGLAQARNALAALRSPLWTPVEADIALLINRHDRRFHHGRREIEWVLGAGAADVAGVKGVAGVIPFDHAAVERAIAAQRPLVLDGRSRAGRAMLDLAGRLHSGRIVLPPEAGDERRRARRLVAGAARAASVARAGMDRLRRGVRIGSAATAHPSPSSDGRLAGTVTAPATAPTASISDERDRHGPDGRDAAQAIAAGRGER